MDEITFGDICMASNKEDLEDLHKETIPYTDEEYDILKDILFQLNAVEHYKSRRQYDKKLISILRENKKKLRKFPSKVDLNILYNRLEKSGQIKHNPSLRKVMRRKFGRSGSGELPVTVFTSPSRFDCPDDCFYCPDEKVEKEFTNPKTGRTYKKKIRVQPRSYLSDEPGCRRAARHKFHPENQSRARLRTYEQMGHEIDKIRFLVLGGTYCYYPIDYRIWFMTVLYYTCNTYYEWNQNHRRDMLSLEEEMRLNRVSSVRIVGITVETRPDRVELADIAHFMGCGITTVQLGIQHVKQDILDGVNRKCSLENIKKGTKRILDNGIKLDCHYMFDLPGPGKHCRLSPEEDKRMLDTIINDPDYAVADQWKLYPCATTPFTRILKWYENMVEFILGLKKKIHAIRIQRWIRARMGKWDKWNGQEQLLDLSKKKYFPYAEIDNGSELIDVIIYAKQNLHKDVRLNRVIRDIPSTNIVGGNNITNLRQEVFRQIEARKLKPCPCIRCREIQGGEFDIDKIQMDVYSREKAKSQDHFVSFEDEEGKIYGLARLRFLNETSDCLPLLKGAAIIREVHVYGSTVKTNSHDSSKPQHSGLGTQLVQKCEKMARDAGYKKIFITSGEGVIEYYRKKHGYQVVYGEYEGIIYHYVMKELNTMSLFLNPMTKFLAALFTIAVLYVIYVVYNIVLGRDGHDHSITIHENL